MRPPLLSTSLIGTLPLVTLPLKMPYPLGKQFVVIPLLVPLQLVSLVLA
jgi:hypothetical protein